MTKAARKKSTYEALLDLPEDTHGELDDGDVFAAPAPLPRHNRLQQTVGRFVGGPFDGDDDYGGPGGWWILTDVDIRFDAFNVRRPDLSGWRRERLPEPWDVRPIDVVPDWVCEILSPSTAYQDLKRKPLLYAAHGVKHYWIIDPVTCLLEVFELHEGKWTWLSTFSREDREARIAPFDAIALDVHRFFPTEPPAQEDPSQQNTPSQRNT